MTREEHLKLLEEKMNKNLEIAKRKNADYAGARGEDDPFSNFRSCEAFGVPTEKGILVRMSDKMSRIGSLLDQDAQVKEETIQDALADLANYSLILSNYLDSKNNKTNHVAESIYIGIGDTVTTQEGLIGTVLGVSETSTEAAILLSSGYRHLFKLKDLKKL